jgi:hypothetical protein
MLMKYFKVLVLYHLIHAEEGLAFFGDGRKGVSRSFSLVAMFSPAARTVRCVGL